MKILKLCLFVIFTFLYVANSFGQGNDLDKYIQGDKAFKAKKYDVAIQFFQEAIKINPKAEKYHYDLGKCYVKVGEMDKALDAFNKAVQVKSDYVDGYKMLARISEAKKDFSQAAEYYKKAVIYDKDVKTKAESLAQAIRLLNGTQKYDSIMPLLQEAKKLEPTNGDLMYMEIRNLNKLTQYDSAIAKAKFMIKNIGKYKGRNEQGLMVTLKSQPPRDLERFNYEIGFAYHKKGRYDSALTHLKLADVGKLKNKVAVLLPEYQYKIASAYFEVFQYEKAQEAIEKALQMNPKYLEPQELKRKIIGMKTEVQGKQRAIKNLEDSVKANKDEKRRADVYCRLCSRQFETFAYEGAAQSAAECLKFFPQRLKVVLWKAVALYRTGKLNDAILDLQNITDNEEIPFEEKAKFAFILGILLKEAAKSPEGDPASQNFTASENFKIAMKSEKYKSAARLEMEGLPGLDDLQEEELKEGAVATPEE